MGTSPRTFHLLGLLFSAIPLLAGVYSAYEVASRDPGQYDTLAIFVTSLAPRLGLALFLSFAVYYVFRAVGAVLLQLDRVSIAAKGATMQLAKASSER
jgi:hypothetical protein